MEATFRSALLQGATQLGVALSPDQLDACARHFTLLVSWNRRINLTRITSPFSAASQHYLDSLALVPFLPPAASLLDVGSGGGFPGLVAAIARPDLQVTLTEPVAKKNAFLQVATHALSLPITILSERAEHLFLSHPSSSFDVVVSRAAMPLPVWLNHGAPLVSPEGLLVAMLGRFPDSLPSPPGFDPPSTHRYQLPCGRQRWLAYWRRSR